MTTLGVSGALREWTRGTSFVLAMGRTQVAALVALDASANRALTGSKSGWFLIGHGHRILKNFVTAVRGLQDRGLVKFGGLTDFRGRSTKDQFAVTEAGEHVLALLHISGVYQELLADFEASDKRQIRGMA